ncbi:hypothetical protein OG350_36845 [Streptomyces achromogenes]|uniref:Uncharacterized protein n=1 Tax=Streptomyces achromogenes TaxID=67255 RepID=A0ABZ1KZS5_STRAH
MAPVLLVGTGAAEEGLPRHRGRRWGAERDADLRMKLSGALGRAAAGHDVDEADRLRGGPGGQQARDDSGGSLPPVFFKRRTRRYFALPWLVLLDVKPYPAAETRHR